MHPGPRFCPQTSYCCFFSKAPTGNRLKNIRKTSRRLGIINVITSASRLHPKVREFTRPDLDNYNQYYSIIQANDKYTYHPTFSHKSPIRPLSYLVD